MSVETGISDCHTDLETAWVVIGYIRTNSATNRIGLIQLNLWIESI